MDLGTSPHARARAHTRPTRSCMHTHARTHVHALSRMHARACMHTQARTRTHSHACMHAHARALLHPCAPHRTAPRCAAGHTLERRLTMPIDEFDEALCITAKPGGKPRARLKARPLAPVQRPRRRTRCRADPSRPTAGGSGWTEKRTSGGALGTAAPRPPRARCSGEGERVRFGMLHVPCCIARCMWHVACCVVWFTLHATCHVACRVPPAMPFVARGPKKSAHHCKCCLCHAVCMPW